MVDKSGIAENDVCKNEAVEKEQWDPKEEINKLLNSIDPEETDIGVMAAVAHKCLRTMSLDDAYHHMVDRNLPVNEENIEKFLEITTKAYLIRLNMLKVVLELNTN